MIIQSHVYIVLLMFKFLLLAAGCWYWVLANKETSDQKTEDLNRSFTLRAARIAKSEPRAEGQIYCDQKTEDLNRSFTPFARLGLLNPSRGTNLL